MSTNHEEMGRKAVMAEYAYFRVVDDEVGRTETFFPTFHFSSCFSLGKLKRKANNCAKPDISNVQVEKLEHNYHASRVTSLRDN